MNSPHSADGSARPRQGWVRPDAATVRVARSVQNSPASPLLSESQIDGEHPPIMGVADHAIDVRAVSKTFGDRAALVRVSLQVNGGEIHALLGPNGAGKTTLLRILAGLTVPSTGTVEVLGEGASATALRRRVGYLPSGDRSFYLRLSGLENLVFFGRLQGLRFRAAVDRAREVLAEVGLLQAAGIPVGKYSHGMQKRLAVARAMLTRPLVVLSDEATHDLDPEGARHVRDLIGALAAGGVAVIWATQRVNEVRGFADTVTLLHHGRVQFAGTVAQLSAHSTSTRFVVRIQEASALRGTRPALAEVVGRYGSILPDGGGNAEIYRLSLRDGVALGDAIAALSGAGYAVTSCQEESPEIERAFLRLIGEPTP